MSALTTAMVLPIVIDLLVMLILVGALYYPATDALILSLHSLL